MSTPAATAAFAHEGVAPEAKSIRDQIRDCLDDTGLERSNSWVQRVSRDYARIAISGTPVALFVATRIGLGGHEELALQARNAFGFLDPTPARAVSNLMHDRTWRERVLCPQG